MILPYQAVRSGPVEPYQTLVSLLNLSKNIQPVVAKVLLITPDRMLLSNITFAALLTNRSKLRGRTAW